MADDMGSLTAEEWVVWAYRLYLGRLPEDAAVVQAHIGDSFSTDRLRRAMAASAEFKQFLLANVPSSSEEAELLHLKNQFRAPPQPGQPGFFIDFLGVRTRCSYLPPAYQAFSGVVEQPDGTGVVPLHDAAELKALLAAAVEATGPFCVVELGAGWGPWLAAGAAAAGRRGLPYRLIGVEGDTDHYGFMRTHLLDNGIDPDAQRVVRAVAGAQDGTARFPVLDDPSGNWGAQASYDPAEGSGPAVGSSRYVEVPCVSVASLLRDVPSVDLLHCDIQGAEGDTLEAAGEALDAKVRRLVVGTHGRGIEERLLGLFARRGWALEHEQACVFEQHGRAMPLHRDGVQVWRNAGLHG